MTMPSALVWEGLEMASTVPLSVKCVPKRATLLKTESVTLSVNPLSMRAVFKDDAVKAGFLEVRAPVAAAVLLSTSLVATVMYLPETSVVELSTMLTMDDLVRGTFVESLMALRKSAALAAVNSAIVM
jgi:hypothetical protein